jgi:predicted Fe-Mo cluster-binding NifX family protein
MGVGGQATTAALTVWEGRISPVFDVSREAIVLTVEQGSVTARHRESLAAPTPALRVERLVRLGIDTLVCGAISEPLRQALEARGVRVLGFVAGEVDEVASAFVAGSLPSAALSMPGCRGRNRRLRRRRGRCGGGLGLGRRF